jgi:NDP-sugar pyrophosphorylase family protein
MAHTKDTNIKRVNILIPMAGKGQRFIDSGYTVPKALLKVSGQRVMELIIENMRVPNAHFIFLIREDHAKEHKLDKILQEMVPDSDVIIITENTEGAICTVLKAQDLINTDEELIIANCDQLADWHSPHFLNFVRRHKADGAIVTVFADRPSFSYAKVNDIFVTSVAEKVVISNYGTVGIYYFRRGKDLVTYGNTMIRKNIRTNNEFYVCPVYNEFLIDGMKILNYPIPEMFSLGTPDEYERNKTSIGQAFENIIGKD